MRYVVASMLVAFAVLTGLFGFGSERSAAQTTAAETPTELCSAEEIARGETATILPMAQDAGVVTPLGSEGEVLYLTVVTLPPDSCLGYRFREGAVVLFVHEGTIEYAAQPTSLEPNPDVWMGGGAEAASDARPVQLDKAVTVHTNEWVTQDRGMWYTFRNGGAEDATVSVASYVVPWHSADPCQGACRQP